MANLPPTTDIEFPITAAALAERAMDRMQFRLDEAEARLVEDLLPRSVRIILAQDPDCAEVLKSRKNLDLSRAIDLIAFTLWSQPGSLGGSRIEQLFSSIGLEEREADLLATAIVRYSRYTMSIVNLLRHYKSAISAVHNMIDPGRLGDRYLDYPGIPVEKHTEWLNRLDELAGEKLKDSEQLERWLSQFESFIAEIISHRAINRNRKGVEPDLGSTRQRMDLGVPTAKAYIRRFGRFLVQEFPVIKLKGRYTVSTREDEAAISIQLDNLAEQLTKSEKQVFEMFKSYYDERNRRMTAMAERSASRRFPTRRQGYEEYVERQLMLSGRKLSIKSHPAEVSKLMVDQVLNLLAAQLEADGKIPEFEGKVSHDGEILILEFEKPSRSDIPRLRSLINRLVSPKD
jgi:hypothetical protein